MNELTKFFLGVLSVIVAAFIQNPLILPIAYIIFSIYLIDNDRNISESHRMLSLLLAMSLIDRYDMSYGVLNIFYISLSLFFIYQFWILYLRKSPISIFWIGATLTSFMIILIISVRSIINIEDLFKWTLLVCTPMLILSMSYKINKLKFFLYLKDINIFLIGIGLGQLLAIFGLIPFSDSVGLDMEYHVVRPTGLSSEPTWFSQQLAILLGINIFSGIKLSKKFYIISFVSLLIIFVCFTRGAYLILLMLTSIIILKNLNALFHRPIMSICLVLLISIIGYSILPYIEDTKIIANTVQKFLLRDDSAGARLEGIVSTINFWLQNPIFGNGFTYSELMVTSEGTATNQKIFNSFLGSLATGGLILFGLYFFIFIYLLLKSLNAYFENQNYLLLFLITSYFLLSSVMPFAYSFFGIFVTMLLSILTTINKEKF